MDLHPFRQRSFKQRASLDGVGLHSGKAVKLTLAPAPADSGITFVRTDCSPHVEIPALSEFVVDAMLNTSLGKDGVRIATVEHVLAALSGCGIENARIELDGPEVPILDGSCAPWVTLIQEAGVRELRANRRFLLVREPVQVQDGDKKARLSPARRLTISYTIDFKHPLISDQMFKLELGERAFAKEIARARTFGFKRDVEKMHRAGLALGGSLENAVVVDDFNILNPEGLRYPDEFVRHKILDAVGDLSLFGMPVIGHFAAVKSGHALNHDLVRKVLLSETAYEVIQPSAHDELHELQAGVPLLAFEEQVA